MRTRGIVGLTLIILLIGSTAIFCSVASGLDGGSKVAVASACLIAIAAAVSLHRQRSRQCQEMDDVISGQAQALAEATDQQASHHGRAEAAALRETAAVEQANASLENAATMTQKNAAQADQASALANEAQQTADRGVTELQAIGEAIDALNQSSNEIAQILKTIDQIAFQTNLLALNAAVEAARAGDAGAGFSIVADEVRRLAKDTAEAAHQTTDKIDTALGWITQCEMLKTAVISTLNDIAAKTKDLAGLSSAVSQGSHQQTEAINQVSATVGTINRHLHEGLT